MLGAVAALIALTSCGGHDGDSATSTENTTEQTAPTSEPDESAVDTDPGDTDPPPEVTAPPSTEAPDQSGLDVAPEGSVPPSAGRDEPLYDEDDVLPGLQPFVDIAVEDLAERLDVAGDDIELHAAVVVVWPDPGLACSAPGVVVPQVLTDGSVIELRHDGTYYAYRSGGLLPPFLCATALEAPPQRADQAGGSGDN